MGDVGSLLVKIGLDLSDFEGGIGKAQSKMDELGRDLTKVGKTISKYVTAPVVAFGVIAVKRFADVGEQISLVSQKVGISVKTISGLRLAAETAGSSLDELVTGFRRLSSVAFEAQDETSAAAATFRSLGVSVVDETGKLRDMESIFFDVADGLSSMTNKTEAAAVAQDVFGRGALNLIPVLQGGSAALREQIKEAERLGITWSTKDAAAAAALDDSVDKLRLVFGGLTKKLVADVIPAITDFFNMVSEKLAKLDPQVVKFGAWGAAIVAAFGGVTLAGGLLVTAVASIIGAIIKLSGYYRDIIPYVLRFGAYIKAVSIQAVTAFAYMAAYALAAFAAISAGLVGFRIGAFFYGEFRSVQSAMNWLLTQFQIFWEYVKTGFKVLGVFVMHVFDGIGNTVRSVVGDMASSIGYLLSKVESLSPEIAKVGEELASWGDQVVSLNISGTSLAGDLADTISQRDAAVEEIKKQNQAINESITQEFGDAARKGRGLSDFLEDVAIDFTALGDALKLGVIDIGDALGFGGGLEELKTQTTDTMDTVASVTESAYDRILAARLKVVEPIMAALAAEKAAQDSMTASLMADMESIGSLAYTVWGQIRDGFADAVAEVVVVGGSMRDMLKSLFQEVAKTIISTLIKMALQSILVARSIAISERISAAAQFAHWIAVSGAAAYASTAAIPIVGPALAPAASRAALAGSSAAVTSGMASGAGLAAALPAMAAGGIVRAPTMALIGEAGPEAVIPLDRMGGGDRSQVITIELDGEVLTRRVVRGMPSELRLSTGMEF